MSPFVNNRRHVPVCNLLHYIFWTSIQNKLYDIARNTLSMVCLFDWHLEDSDEDDMAAGLSSEYSQMELAPHEYKLWTIVSCSGIHWAPPRRHLTLKRRKKSNCQTFYLLLLNRFDFLLILIVCLMINLCWKVFCSLSRKGAIVHFYLSIENKMN